MTTSETTDTRRDLSADQALCDAYRTEWIAEGIYLVEYDRLTEQGCDLIASFERESEAEFAVEARTGWPIAIERAISAEVKYLKIARALEHIKYYVDRDAVIPAARLIDDTLREVGADE